MEQKAFDLITDKVGAVLNEQGFNRVGSLQEENGRAALFTNENLRLG